ncbi:hypothetical protein SDC9_123144 [bioreactor metagenome]|uniref:Uncharacterized protein n=1 Tax=bioreactor metagenome TaxID=1076179 RepID=A0A645CGY4_9ZZZZ
MVVELADGVLGGKPQVLFRIQRVAEAAVRKRLNRGILVVHGLQHAGALEVVNRLAEARAVFAGKDQLGLALFRHAVFGAAVYVAIGVTGDCDGLFPVLDDGLDRVDQNRRAEHRSVQNGADGAVGALPHLGEVIFLHALGVRGDGCALDAHAVLLDGVRTVSGHLVARFFTLRQAEVIVFDLEVDERQDQFFLDLLPEDTGHFVAVHLDERGLHWD